jgi:hypothetical protein
MESGIPGKVAFGINHTGDKGSGMTYPNRRRQNELLDRLRPKVIACDCCRREVSWVRTSYWHGDGRICRDCLGELSGSSADWKAIGNAVRKKHGLPPMED